MKAAAPNTLPKPAFRMQAITTKRDKKPDCSACRNARTELVGKVWHLVCIYGIACHDDAKRCERFLDARHPSHVNLPGMM